MALKLAKEVNGYQFEYWRIDRFDVQKDTNQVWVRMGLYKDVTYAKSGGKHVETKDFTFEGSNYPLTISEISKEGKNSISELYSQIKKPVLVEEVNTNEFTLAGDC